MKKIFLKYIDIYDEKWILYDNREYLGNKLDKDVYIDICQNSFKENNDS